MRQKLLYCDGDRALGQAVQRGCRDVQNLPEQDPVQSAVGEPALAGSWTRRAPEVTANPNHSVIKCLYFKI